MHPQLEAIKRELDEASARLRELTRDLDDARWQRRADPARWSAAENVVHLNLTTALFVPILERALAEAKESGKTGDGPYRRDFAGWLLAKAVEPPVRMLRVKTQPSCEPAQGARLQETIAEFEAGQRQLAGFLERSAGLDLNRIWIVSPFDPRGRMRYNLYSCFRVIPAHQRRHLWLAERVIRRLD